MKCRICSNDNDNQIYEVKEMQFGFEDKFQYFQCSNCGCLQIAEIPSNISKYYPNNYYSYSVELRNYCKQNEIIRYFLTKRNYYAVFNKGFIGKLLNNLFSIPRLRVLSKIPLNINSKILDIGCGNGHYIYMLREKVGFNNLVGLDPFIEKDILYDNGVKIFKKESFEISNKYDLIMYNHSFEHMSDPIKELFHSHSLLNDNGYLLIRIPISDSYPFEKYKESWFNLDAPRHFFLHTVDSMKKIAEITGFIIENIDYEFSFDSILFSEQYKRGIPLNHEKSYSKNPYGVFTKKDIMSYRKEYSKKYRSDLAVFYLKKI